MSSNILFLLIYMIVGLSAVLFVILFIDFYKERGRITRSLNMTLLLITMPQKQLKKDDGAPRREEEKEHIGIAEQFLSTLINIAEKSEFKKFIYGDPYVVFEMVLENIGEEIKFYMAIPRGLETLIEKQINAYYPDASIELIEDYNIFTPLGYHIGSSLRLNSHYLLPIKTYKNLEYDPLENISNSLSKLEKEGEGAAIQIIIKRASSEWAAKGQKVMQLMSEGKSFNEALKGKNILEDFFKTFEDKKEHELKNKKPLTPVDEAKIKAIGEKISKNGFWANIRLIASAKDEMRAKKILEHLENAFQQFASPQLNFFKFNRYKGRKLKKLLFNYSFRIFDNKEQLLLNTEEIASIFHFPSVEVAAPKIKWLKARTSPPPPNLPQEGIILGNNIYRGEETIIRMLREDRRRHFYIIGQTGTGKTNFMKEMIRQDIQNGDGVAVIDPHGEFAETVLGYIPPERVEDVVYFNPADFSRPTGLNMLEFDERYPEQKTLVINEMFNIFDKLYDLRTVGGPMFEQYMKNSMFLVMEDPESGSTLMEISKVLTDEEFRAYKLSKTKNQVVYDFWTKEAEKVKGEASLAELAPYITSKLNMFVANDIMRPIIGQQHSAFNFRKIMDEGKILVVNLSKGRLGDINAYLLGLIIVGKLLIASLSRTDMPEEQRKDFYLYIDEFQNFITDSIATILSEARKYKLNLILAHQFIGQLLKSSGDTKVRDAVFGNVGSMVAFRVGPEDAEFLKKFFEPVFSERDLINVPNFNAYVRLIINNYISPPFSMKINKAAVPNEEIKKQVIQFSRLKYGRDITEIERTIIERSRNFKESVI